MKKPFLTGLITGLIIIGLFGCATSSKKIFGKNVIAETTARDKISEITKLNANINEKRLDRIGEYSYGISIVPNNPPPVNKLNERISSLANQPTEEAKKEMQSIVSELVTNNNNLLMKKDKEIADLQREKITLQNEKEKAIMSYMKLSRDIAVKTDILQSSLDKMDSLGGFGAIWYGTKKLISRFLWGIGIFSIAFIFLRILSISNPLAASIFAIFNLIGSWIVNIIKFIVPKSVDMAGHVGKELFDAYKRTLIKTVDAIQIAKNEAKKNGNKIDIKVILDEIEKMGDEEREIVKEIKKELNYI